MRLEMGDRLAREDDRTAGRRQMPHQHAQGGGLAHAVMTKNAEIFAVLQHHVDAEQDRNAAVAGPHILDLEKRAHAATFLPR